jgi:hypothetical protein
MVVPRHPLARVAIWTAIGLVTLPVACMFDLEPTFTRHGTAALSWTVDGRSDPGACTEHAASFVRIVVRDDDGSVDSDTVRECATFGARFVLHQGAYVAQIGLLDDKRAPIAGQREVPFGITGGRETPVVVDLVGGTILY